MIDNDTLIYDIETKTFGGIPDSEKDIMRVFGCYSYKKNKYYITTDVEVVKKIINEHKYLVAFNNKNYDDVVLKRFGIEFKYKNIIDLYEVINKRQKIIYHKKGVALYDELFEENLDFITRVLGLVDETTAKESFDYSVLCKDTWTKEEWENIQHYTKRDIEITKKLYEWLENYFSPYIPFVKEKDVKNKSYLTSAPSVFTYKVICKELGWEEEYNDNTEEGEGYDGGYVAYPSGKRFEGNIYPLDYSSLYPHLFAQFNLYSIAQEGWHGTDLLKVEGTYNDKEMGAIEKLFMRLFKWRKELKAKKDPGETTIKLVINTAYGISGNRAFKKLFNPITAADCTRLARQCIMLSRRIFREAGYKILYTDTDSVYIQDPFNDENKILETKKKFVDLIKANAPFPQDTFDMALEDKIKYMFFFKGKGNEKEDKHMDEDDYKNKKLGLIKKNYIYVTESGKLVVKNCGVKKKSCSPLTRKIFWDILAPRIISEGQVEFSKAFLEKQINELLQQNIKLMAMRIVAKPTETYKVEGSLQSQISKTYGTGIHFLIPNLKGIGAGKGKSFCTMDEYYKYKMTVKDIDLSGVWSELEYFTKPVITKNIFDFSSTQVENKIEDVKSIQPTNLNTDNIFNKYI
jgi:hypothetical protein